MNTTDPTEKNDLVLAQQLLSQPADQKLFKKLTDRLTVFEPLSQCLLDAIHASIENFSHLIIGRQTAINRCARLLITHSRQMREFSIMPAWRDDVCLLLSDSFLKAGLDFSAHEKQLKLYLAHQEKVEMIKVPIAASHTDYEKTEILKFNKVRSESDPIKLAELLRFVVFENKWLNEYFSIYSQKMIEIFDFKLLHQFILQAGDRLVLTDLTTKKNLKIDVLLARISALGNHYHESGNYEDYIVFIRWAKQMLGSSALLDYHEGIARIALGDIKGWELFAARRAIIKKPVFINTLPTWNGVEKVDRLLIWWPEGAGIGGEVMRLVFLHEIFLYADHIGVVCDQRLHAILHRTFPTLNCHDYSFLLQDQVDTYDAEIDLISLPSYFITQLSNNLEPILKFDILRSQDFYLRFAEKNQKKLIRIKCGISWFTPNQRSQRQRSIRFDELSAWIKKFPYVDFYALQHNIENFPDYMPDSTTQINNWVKAESDIEGLIALAGQMDLVVSIGNSTAHLSGALGVETWVLLPHKPRFQWGVASEKSPFYANMHLVRQKSMGDWTHCFSAVEKRFEQLYTEMNLGSTVF